MEPNEERPRVVPDEQEELLGGIALLNEVTETLDLRLLHSLVRRLVAVVSVSRRGATAAAARVRVSRAVSVHTRVGRVGELGGRLTIGIHLVGSTRRRSQRRALLRVNSHSEVSVRRNGHPLESHVDGKRCSGRVG